MAEPQNPLESDTWNLANISANKCQQYFIQARVTGCQPPTSNTVSVKFGCPSGCQFPNPVTPSGLTGTIVTTISISSTAAVSSSAFTTCGGDIQIKVKNTGAKTLTNYGLVITPDLTTNWVYDSSGNPTVTSTLRGALVMGTNFTVDATTPRSPIFSIDYLNTNEEITLVFHTKINTAGTICDTNLAADPACPGAQTINIAINVYDSCNTLYPNPKTLSVTSTCPDIDIATVTTTPATALVNEGGNVTFNIRLRNNGTANATGVTAVAYFGSGYNITAASDSGVINNAVNPRTVTWSALSINSATNWPGAANATVTVSVGAGDLQARMYVEGYCLDFSGSQTCRHSYDQSYFPRVAAINETKTIFAVNEPGSITNGPTNTTANATIGNAIYFDIQLKLLGEGTYSAFTVRDALQSTNLSFITTNFFLDGEDPSLGSRTWVTVPLANAWSSNDGNATSRYAVTTANPPVDTFTVADGTNQTSFTIASGAGPKYINFRIAARVPNTAAAGNTITNQSQVTFTYDPDGAAANYAAGAYAYSNALYTAILQKTDTITVIEPNIVATKSYSGWGTTYNIGNPKVVMVGEVIPYTLVLNNTGTSPAYDLVITDNVPFGMRKTVPSFTQVFIDTNGDGIYNGADRVLSSPSGYSYTWNSGTGALVFSLEDGNYGDTSDIDRPGAGEAVVIKYNGTVDNDIGPDITMINSVDISYSSIRGTPPGTTGNPAVLPDLNEKSYSASAVASTKSITGTAHITKASALNGSVVAEGDNITYTLTFPNPVLDTYMYGDDDDNTPAGNPEFTDTIPDGLEITGAVVNVNATKFCQTFASVVIPPYLATMPGACAGDDRVFVITTSTVGAGTRKRKLDINFNKLYPGDYLTVTISAKIHDTFDNGTIITDGFVFTNTGYMNVYSAPSGQTRNLLPYTSNVITITYNKLLNITPDRSGQTVPNSWVVYEHTVNNLTTVNENVCFSFASSKVWNWIITDDSGNILTSGATKNSLTIPADGSKKIYIKYFVPSNVPNGTTEKTDILLNRYNAGACDIATIYDTVADTTLVTTVQLQLTKQVRKCDNTLRLTNCCSIADINTCDAVFVENNTGYPCEYLEYKIFFKNISSIPYKNLKVSDVIPDHTDFVKSIYNGNTQDVLVRLPGSASDTFKNALITSSTLEVDLSVDIPTLDPGAEGYIQYKVRIKGDAVCP